MDATNQKRLSWPWLTTVIIGSALFVAALPMGNAWFIFDRSAILQGEVWRMFTGHWVHFSMSHLLYDAIALGIAGFILEQKSRWRFGIFCAVAPWIISAALLVLEPELKFYAGLSGLATGAVMLVCLEGIRDASWKWIAIGGMIAVTAKTVFVTGSGVNFGAPGIEISQASHVVGALVAIGLQVETFALRTFPGAYQDRNARRSAASATPLNSPGARAKIGRD